MTRLTKKLLEEVNDIETTGSGSSFLVLMVLVFFSVFDFPGLVSFIGSRHGYYRAAIYPPTRESWMIRTQQRWRKLVQFAKS